jgi:hypothetical protein
MVPIMWFSIDIVGQQNDQFAAAAIAEHGLRAWVQAAEPDSKNFEIALRQITTDFHEPTNQVTWEVDCAGFDPCEPRGQVVRLRVHVKLASATAVMTWSK